MKSPALVFALTMLALPCRGAVDALRFYTTQGTYPLAGGRSLIISSEKGELSYTLKRDAQETGQRSLSGGLNHAAPDAPFVIYWETDSRTIWWATATSLGYLRQVDGSAVASATFLDPARVDRPVPEVFLREAKAL